MGEIAAVAVDVVVDASCDVAWFGSASCVSTGGADFSSSRSVGSTLFNIGLINGTIGAVFGAFEPSSLLASSTFTIGAHRIVGRV